MFIIWITSLGWNGFLYAVDNDQTIKVGIYENPPKVFTSQTGQPTGIFIDILEHIAKNEGWNIRYVTGTWNQCLERLANGKIDLMPDVAYTAEREKVFAFHREPVLSSYSQVFARKGSGIKSIIDLDKKRVAVLQKSLQQEVFMRLAESFELSVTLIPLPDLKSTFESVANGEADAALVNNFFGLMNSKEFGLEDTSVIFSPAKLLFAASKNISPDILNTIDKYLIEWKHNPHSLYYSTIKKYTSEEIRFKIPVWLIIVGVVILAGLLVSIAGSIILKHQVAVRTQELKQINEEMEKRIIERTKELAEAMERAQAADRIKSAFLATMSHELRTPLNSIIGFTGILLQGLAGPLNPEQHKQLTMVQSSSRHLLALINDVLDISKIESGQLALANATIDLRASIEKTVKLVLPMAQKKGIEIRTNISESVGMITTDQRRLEQVFLNLFNNAVKFTDTGHVLISCDSENDHYRLSVTDTGIGMDPEEIPKIFQPFHQLDTGIARKREGTGLGLSICKKILDLMGASIEVQSELGKGSTFTIRLPKHPKGVSS